MALRRHSQRLGRLRWKASKMRPSAPSRGSVHPSPDGVHPSPRWGAAAPEAGEHCVRRKPKTPRRECFQRSLAFRARCVYGADILSPTRIALGKPGAGRVRSRRRAAEGAHPTLGGARPRPRVLDTCLAPARPSAAPGQVCLLLSIGRGEPYTGPGEKLLSVSREDTNIRRNPLGDTVRVSAVTFVWSHSQRKQQCTCP